MLYHGSESLLDIVMHQQELSGAICARYRAGNPYRWRGASWLSTAKKSDEDIWHFCSNCAHWPTSLYASTNNRMPPPITDRAASGFALNASCGSGDTSAIGAAKSVPTRHPDRRCDNTLSCSIAGGIFLRASLSNRRGRSEIHGVASQCATLFFALVPGRDGGGLQVERGPAPGYYYASATAR